LRQNRAFEPEPSPAVAIPHLDWSASAQVRASAHLGVESRHSEIQPPGVRQKRVFSPASGGLAGFLL